MRIKNKYRSRSNPSGFGVSGLIYRRDDIPKQSKCRKLMDYEILKMSSGGTSNCPRFKIEFVDGYWLGKVWDDCGSPGYANGRFATERQVCSWIVFEIVHWQRWGLSMSGYYTARPIFENPLDINDRLKLFRSWFRYRTAIFRVWEVG